MYTYIIFINNINAKIQDSIKKAYAELDTPCINICLNI